MDYRKIATKAAFQSGLSKRKSEEVGSNIAVILEKELSKSKPVKESKKKDVTEVNNTYKEDVVIKNKKGGE